MTVSYVIRFQYDIGEPPFYAGRTRDGSLGWAMRLETAEKFKSREIAENFAKNGYGPGMFKIAKVIEVPA